jgi:antitoxin component YwqK of YwqJK toxin-antitoxin module
MKIMNSTYAILILAALLGGCRGGSKQEKNNNSEQAASAVSDTGFTGIKQYRNNQRLIKEVTFKNSVREGLMKSFYMGGQLYQTFWYEKGLREDSARYYYLEGQLFRTTPYKHDTIDGIQKQYYRTGGLKARIGYSRGMRTTLLQEFTKEGKLVSGYPDILVVVDDKYKSEGTYKIVLGISDMSAKVKFYRGEFTDSRFDTTICKFIAPVSGKHFLILKKTGQQGADHVGIIASISTNFGNRYLTYKKIDLPYKDLK